MASVLETNKIQLRTWLKFLHTAGLEEYLSGGGVKPFFDEYAQDYLRGVSDNATEPDFNNTMKEAAATLTDEEKMREYVGGMEKSKWKQMEHVVQFIVRVVGHSFENDGPLDEADGEEEAGWKAWEILMFLQETWKGENDAGLGTR